MLSFPDAPARRRQSGFSLLEVMFASMILSIFILGIGGFWVQASSRGLTAFLYQRDREIIALARRDLAVAETG